MAGRIQVLPEHIAQTIAAGEVVERPASVVKELMENAIDAGASEIIVELRAGGFELIRVQDNGEGMEREDLPLALQRHATSKIRQIEDLYAVQTLGFRGEALPSIASVSQMKIKTRVAHSIRGATLVSEGGEIKQLSDAGCPVGTEVEVRTLFFNLPVKRKFLKSIALELRHGLNHFIKLSLSCPAIGFKFIHDGRLLHEHLKTGSFLVRIEAILGKEMAGQLQAVEYEDGGMKVSGFASLPTASRGNADGIYIYVNRRYVKDRMVYRAILDSYRHSLPPGRFPIVILFLDVRPSAVDVNVHPTKAEVKFRNPDQVFHAVFTALRLLHEQSPSFRGRESGEERKEKIPGRTPGGYLPLVPSYPPRPLTPTPRDGGKTIPMVRESSPGEEGGGEGFPLHLLGQVQGTYLLCETEKGLIFIDQHAAHERVLFERLKREYETRSIPVIKFLLPVLIELSAEDSFILSSHLEELQSFGFEIDPAGERAFAVRSVPSFVEKEEPKEVIQRILGEVGFLEHERSGAESAHPVLISLACHGAIKGNWALRREEMVKLLESLEPFPSSTTCPHGRPVFFFLGWEELGKQFRRNRRG